MASRYYRLMDLRKLTASASQARDQYVDAGAYRTLEVDARVPSAGSAGNLLFQHAAVPEEDAFRTLTRFSWSCSIPDEGVVGQEGTFSATGCHAERGGCFPVTTSEGESGHASGRPAGRDDLMPEREERGG